jgi:hypothetical protein
MRLAQNMLVAILTKAASVALRFFPMPTIELGTVDKGVLVVNQQQ